MKQSASPAVGEKTSASHSDPALLRETPVLPLTGVVAVPELTDTTSVEYRADGSVVVTTYKAKPDGSLAKNTVSYANKAMAEEAASRKMPDGAIQEYTV